MSKHKISFKSFLPYSLIVILIAITLLSLLPPKSSINLGSQDKVSHFIAYFFLTINALLISEKHIKSILLIILYGIILEYLQSFVPGRFTSYNDIIANSLGSLSGLLIILTSSKKINRNDSLNV